MHLPGGNRGRGRRRPGAGRPGLRHISWPRPRHRQGTLRDEKEPTNRATIVEGLGKLRVSTAFEALASLADSRAESDELRSAACMALANQLRKNGRVTVVYFGDSASCEGAFFETLNMATLWKVPLVLVCENNGFAISVPTRMAIPVENISQRAAGFGLPGVTVDGNDPLRVFDAMTEAVARARRGEGPTLVECKTVRWERHSAISAGKYENEEEAMKWKKADPIPRFEKLLREMGATDQALAERRSRAKQVNDEALEFAQHSEFPKPESVGDFVFA